MGGRPVTPLSASGVLPRHPLVGRLRSHATPRDKERETDETADRPEAVDPPRGTAEDDAFAALLARLSRLEDEVDCLVPRVRGLRAGLLRAQADVHGGLRRIEALEARHARGDSSAGR